MTPSIVAVLVVLLLLGLVAYNRQKDQA